MRQRSSPHANAKSRAANWKAKDGLKAMRSLQVILNLVEEPDFCSVGFLIVLLCLIGSKLIVLGSRVHKLSLGLAFCAFLAYCVYGFIRDQPENANGITSLALRGLLAAGLMLGVSWILLPVVAFAYKHGVQIPRERLRTWKEAADRSRQERNAAADKERRRQMEEDERRRNTPHREQAAREAEVRAKMEGEAQRRRDRARARCELLYSEHAKVIGEAFRKEMFDDFIAKYMNDHRSPEEVEEWGEQLHGSLTRVIEGITPAEKHNDLDGLMAWYEGTKAKILNSEMTDTAKKAHLSELSEEFSSRMTRMLMGGKR